MGVSIWSWGCYVGANALWCIECSLAVAFMRGYGDCYIVVLVLGVRCWGACVVYAGCVGRGWASARRSVRGVRVDRGDYVCRQVLGVLHYFQCGVC